MSTSQQVNKSTSPTLLKAAPKINTEIKDVVVTCNHPFGMYAKSHNGCSLVLPAVEHANEGI